MGDFTPGSWAIDGDNELQINGPKGEPLAWTETCVGFEKDRANAKLIAATPDFLEVSKRIDFAWTRDFPEGPEKQDIGEFARLSEETIQTWRMIRAALQKAGVTP